MNILMTSILDMKKSQHGMFEKNKVRIKPFGYGKKA